MGVFMLFLKRFVFLLSLLVSSFSFAATVTVHLGATGYNAQVCSTGPSGSKDEVECHTKLAFQKISFQMSANYHSQLCVAVNTGVIYHYDNYYFDLGGKTEGVDKDADVYFYGTTQNVWYKYKQSNQGKFRMFKHVKPGYSRCFAP